MNKLIKFCERQDLRKSFWNCGLHHLAMCQVPTMFAAEGVLGSTYFSTPSPWLSSTIQEANTASWNTSPSGQAFCSEGEHYLISRFGERFGIIWQHQASQKNPTCHNHLTGTSLCKALRVCATSVVRCSAKVCVGTSMSHRKSTVGRGVGSYNWYLESQWELCTGTLWVWAVKYWDVLLGNHWLSNKQSSSPIFLSQFNEKIHNYSTFLNFPPGFCLIPLFTFWNVGFKYLILILKWFSYHPKDWCFFQFRSCCKEPFLSMW